MRFKMYIVTIMMLSFSAFATNTYDLTPGTVRYYVNSCNSLGVLCIADDANDIGKESVLKDTLIDGRNYAKVLWEYQENGGYPTEVEEYIEFYRYENENLYFLSDSGEVIVQNFHFTKGDSLQEFYDYSGWYDQFGPSTVLIDTSATFSDGHSFRVCWGDVDSFYVHQ